MAINERLIHSAAAETAAGATGNQEDGLMLYLDANDIDSYDGVDGATWYNITNHEFTPAVDPSDHFNTVLYNNNSRAVTDITGVGFKPDLVWIKDRNNAEPHLLVDSVGGISAGHLRTSYNIGRYNTYTDSVTAFIDDGFTVGADTIGFTNYTGRGPYVAWCFKAGGAPTASTPFMVDGTGYATMQAAGFTDGTEALDSLSVNTKLGFSIAKLSGSTALTGDTVAHGLGETPELIIYKSTSLARDWNVYSKPVGLSKNLHLNQDHEARTNEYWTVNTNTFSIHDTSSSGDWIAYSFASKRGVSKVGSYTGTGSSGNKVYTGFQPAFVLYKRTDSTGNWQIGDNQRGAGTRLYADLNNNEDSGTVISFNADGFTVNGTGSHYNANGGKYIYLAFAAEKPDSLIDDTDLELHLDPASYSGSGTTWTADTGNNGTLVDDTSYDQELGDFFDLDGSGDYISLNTSGYLDGDFTIEMWWNFDNLTPTNDYQMLWGASGYGGSGSGLGHYINDNKIQTWIDVSGSTSNPVTSGAVLTQNKWHHIVLTRSGGTYTQFLDGSQVATGSGSSASLDSSTTRIGASSANSLYNVDGRVGQVRVYDKALSADEVMQNYRFTKSDYPANGHATINGPTFTPAAGYNPDFFAFDGVNDYMELDYIHPPLLETTANLWIKFGDITPTQNDYFLSGTSSSGSNASNNLHLGLLTSGRLYAEYGSIYGYLTASEAETNLTADTWAMLSFVWSDSSIKYYKNGVLQTTTSGFSNIGNIVNTTKLHLGRFGAYNGYYTDMDIGQLKIYDKELTADELVAEFNKHKADYGL